MTLSILHNLLKGCFTQNENADIYHTHHTSLHVQTSQQNMWWKNIPVWIYWWLWTILSLKIYFMEC